MTDTLVPQASRIVDLFLGIDIADVNAGIAWYGEARAISEELATRHGITVEQAAGIIAVFSPMNDWEQNVKDAARWLESRVIVHTPVFMRKAERILEGEDIRTVLNAPKTTNFWVSILSEGAEGICIDRHAYDIAVGVRHTDKGRSIGIKAYRACAEAYAEAAEILSGMGCVVSPAEVQSVTWVAWRKVWKGIRNTVSVAA